MELNVMEPAARQLAKLMAASNAGEAHAVFRGENGEVSACIILAEGQKALDVMEMISNLEQVWGEIPDEDCKCTEHGAEHIDMDEGC